MNVSENQLNQLRLHLPNIDDVIKSNDVNELLLLIDDLITQIGFNKDYELTTLGLKLQRLYDEIFNQNE